MSARKFLIVQNLCKRHYETGSRILTCAVTGKPVDLCCIQHKFRAAGALPWVRRKHSPYPRVGLQQPQCVYSELYWLFQWWNAEQTGVASHDAQGMGLGSGITAESSFINCSQLSHPPKCPPPAFPILKQLPAPAFPTHWLIAQTCFMAHLWHPKPVQVSCANLSWQVGLRGKQWSRCEPNFQIRERTRLQRRWEPHQNGVLLQQNEITTHVTYEVISDGWKGVK